MTEENYQEWSQKNQEKQFFNRISPFNFHSDSKENISLMLNNVGGIQNLDVVFLQASLFKSKELIYVLQRFFFLHPTSHAIVFFDKDQKNNQLLLEKLTGLGCEIFFKTDDWVPYHDMLFIPNRPEFLIPVEKKLKTFLFWKRISQRKRIKKQQKKIQADYQLY